jgi:filamentous hemagglutinin
LVREQVAQLTGRRFLDIDRVATLYTRGQGILLASAGNNINLTAAQLSSGGDVQISAANNLTLSTITSNQSNNFGAGNADNHFLSSNSKELGTTIQSAGNTALAAGNTLSATAASVNAAGDLSVSAQNIALLAGTSKASSDSVMAGPW